jgi:hypothetical protein
VGERVSYPVTGRLTYATTSGFNGGVSVVPGQIGVIVSAPISIGGNIIQTNQLGGVITQTILARGAAIQTNQIGVVISATLSAAGDLGSSFTPSLDFSDARNSQYAPFV